MKREILSEAVKLNIARRRRKRWYQAVSAMAAVVVFVTTYALILPAITMEKDTICGLEEHVHTSACYYEPVLDTGWSLRCGYEVHEHDETCRNAEGELLCGHADFVIHAHEDICYGTEGELLCEWEEFAEHAHNDTCYEKKITYTCGLEEGENSHIHAEACFSLPELICTTVESEGHTHDETCFETINVCTLEESNGHIHGEECYTEIGLVCGVEESEEHTHSDACYGEYELICVLEETEGHIHNESCSGELQLICGQEENEGHVHNEETCYEQPVLICGQEESEGHVHNETCSMEVQYVLICEEEEIILHTHEDSCYDETEMLTCGMLQVTEHQHGSECFAQHVHTEDCYRTTESETLLICGYHVHDDTCYDEQGLQICSQPVLICGMEEHIHVESCYPEVDDGLVEATFCVPEEYLGYIQSEAVFPLTYTLEEGSSLSENGGAPTVSVINPDTEAPEYLTDYHWMTPDGFPVDETTPLEEDVTLTLQLYPADDPDAARLVTATFVCGEEILLTRTVNSGTVVSDLISADVQQRLDELQTEQRRFDRWIYSDETGTEAVLESGVTVIEQDTVYTAVFREYASVILHDIDPDGAEYAGSPLEMFLPVGSSLSEQRVTLGDGTPVASCQWYEENGAMFECDTPMTESLELYTYSYSLQLNLTPLEAVPMLMMLSLEEETDAAPEPQANRSTLEETTQEEDESISIVKRSGEALTESDFVVDGVNYSSYQWIDESGSDVDTDDLVGTTLTSNYALTRAASTEYTITYNINVNASSVFGTVPTVGGGTTVSDTFNSDDGTYNIRVPTPASYMVTNGTKRTLYQFTGWKISRNSNIIAAGETVDADWVADNVNRWSSTVTLTAQWTSVVVTETVHFYVNVNCQVTDVEGNTEVPSSGDYTPSVFSTTMTVAGASMTRYWQGANLGGSQYIVFRADTARDTEAVDAEIRRLINGHDSTYDTYNGASVWASGYTGTKVFQVEDFPSDEHVLSVVRDMVESGTVIRMNGVALTAEELTSDNFTVRWNVCKYDSGDGWHIDGILVGKQAHLTVKKTFLGDDTAVQAVKDGGFTITIENTTNAAASDVTLTLNSAAAETGSGRMGYSSYDAGSDTYTWTVPLEQNNKYAIIENDYISTDDAVQTSASYTISNSPAAFTGWKAYPDGGVTNVTAYAYASDVSADGYQTVALRNSYVKADTLTINKIDMDTGNGLAGISYRLTDASGNGLTLYKKPDASYYSMKDEDLANGFVRCADSVITTGSNGAIFLKLDTGTFTLEEAFPTGYGGASTITVTVGADSSGNVTFEEVTSSDSTIEVDGALIDTHTATLTIRNVSYSTSVTAQKIWADSADVQEVIVDLYRNGVSMGSEYQKVLSKSNNWTYTWNDLPLYADGAAAEYSLREIKIGNINYDPSADTDGYSGYIVTYDDMVYFKNGERVSGPVWVDDNGVTQYADNAHLAVRNEVYRGQMVFLKVDGNGKPLAGATFRLYADTGQTQILAEATSDEYGRVIFENLMPDTYYVVKESDTPEGYLGADSLYKVRLSAQGSTTVEDTSTGEALTAIVNYADEVEVTLHKISELGYDLANTQFQLEQQVDGVWTILGSYETDSAGKIFFGKLGAGTYRLVEIHPPDGFMALSEPIGFDILNGELTLLNNGDWSAEKDDVTGVCTITVINRSGYELPQTGGPTARMYTYGGLLLILSAAALFGYQNKRRREENSS